MISGSLWYLTMLLGLEEQSITACWILGFWNAIASSGSPMSFEMASCGVMPMAANCSCTSGEFMSGMPSWGEKLPPPAFICFMIPLSWSLYMGLDRSISNVSGLRIISGRYGYIISCIWGLRSMFCMYSRSSGESSPSSPTGSPVTVSAAAASAAKASAKGLGTVEGPASSVASAKKLPEPTAPDSSFFSSFFSSAAVAPARARRRGSRSSGHAWHTSHTGHAAGHAAHAGHTAGGAARLVAHLLQHLLQHHGLHVTLLAADELHHLAGADGERDTHADEHPPGRVAPLLLGRWVRVVALGGRRLGVRLGAGRGLGHGEGRGCGGVESR